jgi:hemerythrin-like domain-containing protein
MRYQFYREHKYVSAALNDLERLIAKTDFRSLQEVKSVDQAFQLLAEMLKGHAQYENERLHTLLKNKRSPLYEHAEEDHAHQDEELLRIQKIINRIYNASTDQEKTSTGYTLYLTYRKFVADNLIHLHEEETVILPELQRLYTDEELKQVQAQTYKMMTPKQMVHMMQVLFPHMNPLDRLAFLSDIQQSQPEKFMMAWDGIASSIEAKERANLALHLQVV